MRSQGYVTQREPKVHAHTPSWLDLQSLYSYASPRVGRLDYCLANIHSFPPNLGLHGKKILPDPLVLGLATWLSLCNVMLVYMIRLKNVISLRQTFLCSGYPAIRRAPLDSFCFFQSKFQEEHTEASMSPVIDSNQGSHLHVRKQRYSNWIPGVWARPKSLFLCATEIFCGCHATKSNTELAIQLWFCHT